jgi:hypothetical protein
MVALPPCTPIFANRQSTPHPTLQLCLFSWSMWHALYPLLLPPKIMIKLLNCTTLFVLCALSRCPPFLSLYLSFVEIFIICKLVVLSSVKCPEVKTFSSFKAFHEAKCNAIYPCYFSGCQGFPGGTEFVCCSNGANVDGRCGNSGRRTALCPKGTYLIWPQQMLVKLWRRIPK